MPGPSTPADAPPAPPAPPAAAARLDTALVPAAGDGIRAYPATTRVPKVLLEVAGKSLLQRNLEILRDEVGVRRAIVVVGRQGDAVRERFGDGSALGLALEYVDCPDPSVGLARGILPAAARIRGPFVTLLGDELYLGSNHRELAQPEGDAFAVCGLLHCDDLERIRRNYAVWLEGDRITDLEEKPASPPNRWLGCGTYVFGPELFERIRATPPSPRTGRVELTNVIAGAARAGRPVRPFYLTGEYVNVNTLEDHHHASHVVRSLDFPKYRISVVIPAFQEQASIGAVVTSFLRAADEVLVVDNGSTDATAAVAREHGARVERVRVRGYGDAIRHGLDRAEGDILVVVEADHSFRVEDLGKLLEYLKSCDMVIGTRTTRQLIEQGSNMRGLLRWGNVAVGKLVELLWWSQEPRLTDVGCTYRALWRETWREIRGRLETGGPEFSPEMMIEVLRARKRLIEIPVSYHPRAGGASKHSDDLRHVARTATRMLRVIAAKRLGSGLGPRSGRGSA